MVIDFEAKKREKETKKNIWHSTFVLATDRKITPEEAEDLSIFLELYFGCFGKRKDLINMLTAEEVFISEILDNRKDLNERTLIKIIHQMQKESSGSFFDCLKKLYDSTPDRPIDNKNPWDDEIPF